MSFFLGEDFYEPSPYEPMMPHRHSDAFRLASIISGNYQYFHYEYILAMCCTVCCWYWLLFIAISYMKLRKSSSKWIIITFQYRS